MASFDLHTYSDLMRKRGDVLHYICGRTDPDVDSYRMVYRILAYKKSCHPEAKKIVLAGVGAYRDLERLKSIRDSLSKCTEIPVFISWIENRDEDYDTPVEPKYGEYRCLTCGNIVPEREVFRESRINKYTGYTGCTCHNCWYKAQFWGPN